MLHRWWGYMAFFGKNWARMGIKKKVYNCYFFLVFLRKKVVYFGYRGDSIVIYDTNSWQ